VAGSRPLLTDQQSSTKRYIIQPSLFLLFLKILYKYIKACRKKEGEELTIHILVPQISQPQIDHLRRGRHDLVLVDVASERVPRVPAQRGEAALYMHVLVKLNHIYTSLKEKANKAKKKVEEQVHATPSFLTSP